MPRNEMRLTPARVAQDIAEFSRRCEERQETDTGDAWEHLRRAETALRETSKRLGEIQRVLTDSALAMRDARPECRITETRNALASCYVRARGVLDRLAEFVK